MGGKESFSMSKLAKISHVMGRLRRSSEGSIPIWKVVPKSWNMCLRPVTLPGRHVSVENWRLWALSRTKGVQKGVWYATYATSVPLPSWICLIMVARGGGVGCIGELAMSAFFFRYTHGSVRPSCLLHCSEGHALTGSGDVKEWKVFFLRLSV